MNKNIISPYNYNDISLTTNFTNNLAGSNSVNSALQKIDQYNISQIDDYLHKKQNTYTFNDEIVSINIDSSTLSNYKIFFSFYNTELPINNKSGVMVRYNNDSSSIYKTNSYFAELGNIGVTTTTSSALNYILDEFRIENSDTRKLTVTNGSFVGKIEGNLNVNCSRLASIESMNARTNGTVFSTFRMFYEYQNTLTPITTINIYTYHKITGDITFSSY